MLVVIFSILNHMETSGLFFNHRWEISVHLAKIVKQEITCHGHCFLDRVNLKMMHFRVLYGKHCG